MKITPPSEKLRNAYTALINFSPDMPAETPAQQEAREQMVAGEAQVDPLRADAKGFTPGMHDLLRQVATPQLSDWRKLRANFDEAIQPFADKINAVRDFEAKKAVIEHRFQQKEADINLDAEANQTYRERKNAKENSDRNYNACMQAEGNRPVNFFGLTWKYALILLCVTSVEWLINFDAFMAWTHSPMIASGFTIGAAAAVAIAAHVHGEYLKQRNARFGPASETKGRDITYITIATSALLAAVIVAGWARYSLAMQDIAQGPMIQIEGAMAQANPLTDVYFSLGINLIVWLIAVVIAFMSHDENHELMRAWSDQRHHTKQFNRSNKPWERRIASLRADRTSKIESLKKSTDRDDVEVKEQRDMLEQVNQREHEIYRMLANHLQGRVNLYRINLDGALLENGHQIIVGERALSGQQYQSVVLSLDAATLRSITQ